MKHLARAALRFTLALTIIACNRGTPQLPPGAKLGDFQDVDRPESYSGATLYTYLDGGAEFFLNQGFSTLFVRHYAHGTQRFTVELFEMKDPPAAARAYQNSRRPRSEKELAPGCLATITPSDVQTARGRYYLEARNDDPLAAPSPALLELTTKLLNGLPGSCPLPAKY